MSKTERKALVERLRAKYTVTDEFSTIHRPVNPDGAVAAGLIEAQAAEIARLRATIKTQANAVRTLHNNEETEINRLRKQRHEWHHAVTSLDSEREANAILTAEIERLREDCLRAAVLLREPWSSVDVDDARFILRAALAQETQP